MSGSCAHVAEVRNVSPKTPDGCEECLQMGSDWVHLRLCLSCGHVGCCDNSPNKHATKHFKSTKHPIIRSFEPGETWEWCFVDNTMIDSNYTKMSPKNTEDKASKASGADLSSYQRQAIVDLSNNAVTTEDIMSAQTGISQKKIDKIKGQDTKKEELVGKNKYLKESSHSSFVQSSSS